MGDNPSKRQFGVQIVYLRIPSAVQHSNRVAQEVFRSAPSFFFYTIPGLRREGPLR